MSFAHSSRPSFHRHCTQCGWGFTFASWQRSRFCARCGKQLSRNRNSDARPFAYSKRQPSTDAHHRPWHPQQSGYSIPTAVPATPQRIYAEVERVSPTTTSSSITPKVRMVMDTVRRHPFICAAAGLTGGFALGIAGGLIVAAGAAIAISGAGLAATAQSTGLVILVLAILGRSPQIVGAALGIMLAGTLAGAVIAILGTLVTALGSVLSVLGTISLVLSTLLAAGRLSHLAYQHRKDICQLIERIRAKIRPSQPALSPTHTLTAPMITDMSHVTWETR